MKRTWTETGVKCVPENNRDRVSSIIYNFEWESIPCAVGMMPGENIKGIIAEFKMPKVSHIAITHEMAPYGFYGIRAHYTNGKAQLYILDRGSDCVPIASDFWPN